MTEPDSNSITSEQLASRVRQVVGRRFRRDGAAVHTPKAAKPAVSARNWTTQAYDFLVISLAIFLLAVLILNMSVAGSWRERGNQWGDRARWQRELQAWEQQLAKQEKQLELECQRLAATLIARRGPEEQQQALDQISNFRQQLRAANQSLGATIRQGNGQSIGDPNSNAADPEQLAAAALKTKRLQLIEMQYAARSQYNSEHPTLQAIENQIEELERQLATAGESPANATDNDSGSRVQVIENQYLRNASSSSSGPVAASNELPQQAVGVEQRFAELRLAAEICLRDIDQQHLSLQRSDLQRASAWEQVANSLRAMARQCTLPAALQKTIAKQDELRIDPTISPLSLFVGLIAALGIAAGIVWRSRTPTVVATKPARDETETLSVNLVTKQLGCAPAAILPWDMLTAEASHASPETSLTMSGKTLQQKIRFASECLLAGTIAVTLLVALTHGQFGDWLLANPLTAWGHLWGS